MKLDYLRIKTSLTGSQTNAKDLEAPQSTIAKTIQQDYEDGTGADQAQVIFSDTRSLAASASESLDLAGGLPHPLGGTITFTAIKEILVVAADANSGNLRVGAGVANAFVGPFGAAAVGNLVAPGGLLHQREPSATGWAVTAGTGDLLRVENLSGSAANSYDLVIIGEGTVA